MESTITSTLLPKNGSNLYGFNQKNLSLNLFNYYKNQTLKRHNTSIMLKANFTKCILRKTLFHNIIKTIIIPGIIFISFSHLMVELFGHIIPNFFLSFFREVSIMVIVGAALLFIAAWLVRALPPNLTKNYTLTCFDVFGKESFIDGLRTEFKTNDVAWSFMKEYKKKYPLYNFGLVTENSNSEKKTIIRYL